MLNSSKMTCDFLGLKEGDIALLCLPVQYISGKMILVRAIERKLKVIISVPSSAPEISENVEFCAMTPLQVQNSLDKIHFIKNLIIGGAAVSEKLKNEIFTTLQFSNSHTRIYETYGMSETLSHIALRQISPIQENYFTIFNDVEISVDDRNCLRIFAPKLNPEILQTNDIVELMHFDSAQCDKKQFKFLGRFDNVINSGGVKIFAEELENLVRVFNDDGNIYFHANKDMMPVRMDRIYLSRIFTNMITNAKQAVSEQRKSIINIDAELFNKKIIIVIEDNGIGIPKDKLEQIFEPNFTTKNSGMGLGLTMVKKMIEEYKGDISVKSEEGKGTKFTIILPTNV